MTEMPVVYVRATWADEEGKTFEGVSASGIPPLWFDKRDGKTAADNERDLLLSLRAAIAAYQKGGLKTAWAHHKAVTEPVRSALVAQGQAPLAAGFGPALLEAALVDGLCRRRGLPLSGALHTGVLGVPDEILRALPAAPQDFMALRHTVGLADPLTSADVAAPLRDGLPETLEEVIGTYKPAYFKVKINGDPAESRARLRGIAAVLRASGNPYAVTLDGNEQFGHMDAFADFMESLLADARAETDSSLREFLERILWIEQPVRRDAALDPSSGPALARVSTFRPVILDESDGEEDALERGLALGYGGVSSKTCKGLFRSLSHAGRLARARAKTGRDLILSCEDLTTVPVHPLQQDLCLAAALGLTHAERNGHHYIRPAGFLTVAECRAVQGECPSLYETPAGGEMHVRIAGGGFDLREVNRAHGLGTTLVPEWGALEKLEG